MSLFWPWEAPSIHTMVISLVAAPSDLLNAPLSNLLLLLLLAKGFFPSARKERKRPLFSPKGRSKGGTVFSLVSPQHFSSSSAPSNLFPGGENVRLRSSFFPPSCIFPPPPRASLPLQGMQKKGDTNSRLFFFFLFLPFSWIQYTVAE